MDGEITLPELTRAEILDAVNKVKTGLMTTRLRAYTENDWRTGACWAEGELSDLLYRSRGIDPEML